MAGTATDATDTTDDEAENSSSLTPAQRAALRFVAEHAISRSEAANQLINEVLRMSNLSRPPANPIDERNNKRTGNESDDGQTRFEKSIRELKNHARVALHFHPDRPGANGDSVAGCLLSEGFYRSQFETGISNGGLTAYPGGARQRWEEKLFGGAYEQSNADPDKRAHERPKYGALDVMRHADGPSPRFGSCYFLLMPTVSRRCTLTYMDSSEEPETRGTVEAFDDIVAAMLGDVFKSDFTLGESNLTPPRLIDHLLENSLRPLDESVAQPATRNLNHYIEAQVHGEVSLAEDVEALVIDPCFTQTQTGKTLESLCNQYEIALYQHGGFALPVDEIPSDFRGPSMPSLAARIATNDIIDVGVIGRAVTELKGNSARFSDRGSHDEVLQELKLLWHVLVRYGRPAGEFGGPGVKLT
ncbi:MAG: DUF3626 domain-containing protein [Myxococcales bacterium]|nr:DUF3626 domain-containing protein [Myxococcales bacterium]HIK83745.1 DUF3626 domain-containing protein [Myxococcales bacterium]